MVTTVHLILQLLSSQPLKTTACRISSYIPLIVYTMYLGRSNYSQNLNCLARHQYHDLVNVASMRSRRLSQTGPSSFVVRRSETRKNECCMSSTSNFTAQPLVDKFCQVCPQARYKCLRHR
ncbi:hypothetical protein QBC46DRAFT_32127 [Diplogelasinospora grovesii]|uniref:Uncharacterized protein n=1 Tax=Diplogelasinospora grovesii TaxID=303347 RepID=A0AAN6MZF3_9PEZI|nr:hypothetical protein QBC46DRAFT_32127 [Diplogelasinospora grovesii]